MHNFPITSEQLLRNSDLIHSIFIFIPHTGHIPFGAADGEQRIRTLEDAVIGGLWAMCFLHTLIITSL